LFSWIAEYPILLVAAPLCRPTNWKVDWAQDRWALAAVAAAGLIVLGPSLVGQNAIYRSQAITTAIFAFGLIVAAATWRNVPLFAALLGAALFAARLYPPEGSTRMTFRSFFGVHKVHDSEDRRFRLLQHGTTLHGAQRIRDKEGRPITGRPEPLTYYARGSP